ncbi:hypothetical protein KSD_13630 [Ktedonobacter sp. SOSP1-85]|nr:hypothetical protein KSD_13630 [Ktedonobacter sp. SOSP1-85]
MGEYQYLNIINIRAVEKIYRVNEIGYKKSAACVISWLRKREMPGVIRWMHAMGQIFVHLCMV